MKKLFYLFMVLFPVVVYAQQNWVKSSPLYEWVNVGNAGFSAGYCTNVSLAFSPSEQPYVAYIDDGNN